MTTACPVHVQPASLADSPAGSRVKRVCAAVLLPVLLLGLAACDKKKEATPPSQVAARVNSQEITIHQINQVLEQQRALPPEQAASASRQVLLRLVDQELALQEAQNQKLDRDPKVVRQLDAARREIIARAYVERLGATVAAPSAEDVKKYYDAHPALFKERRIYTFDETLIEATPAQVEALKPVLQTAKGPALAEQLKAQGIRSANRQAVTAAEQLPLDRLEMFAAMTDGHVTVMPIPQGLRVLTLVSSRQQPVDEARARPMIEQFLLNERRQKAVQGDLASLRSSAKIEYMGEFAGTMAGAVAAAAAAASGAAPSASMVENALKGLK